eukprot:91954_1
MGCCLECCCAKYLNSLMGIRETRTLMIGLDNAGKTTILYKLKMGEIVNTVPTTGFNVETVESEIGNDCKSFTLWDVGGAQKIKNLWRHYYQNTQFIIFVVDSTDSQRLGYYNLMNKNDQKWSMRLLVDGYIRECVNGNIDKVEIAINTICLDYCNDCLIETRAVEDLHTMLREDELRDAILLVYANKQDLSGALSIDEITDRLGLNTMENRPWHIVKCSAYTGEGLQEGIDWMHRTYINRKY